jgi:hypothetical protein
LEALTYVRWEDRDWRRSLFADAAGWRWLRAKALIDRIDFVNAVSGNEGFGNTIRQQFSKSESSQIL